MKIISKFQDFYEFDCYRYGEPSPMPQWVRNEADLTIELDNKIVGKIRSFFLPGFSNNKNYKGKYVYHRYSANYRRLNIKEEIIGIYPYIYYIPIVYYNICNDDDITPIDLSADDSLLLITEPDAYKTVLEHYGLNYKECLYPDIIIDINKQNNLWNPYDKDVRNILKDDMIKEWHDIFQILNIPTFRIKSDCNLFITRFNKTSKLKYTANPFLGKTKLLSYYPNILSERDIYTELENYLILKQQDPISEPDNKTKIISHGFDLKSSFRNVK